MKLNSVLKKTILYRTLSFFIALGVVYVLTGSVPKASKIVVVLETVKFFEYYIFESIFKIKAKTNVPRQR